MTWPFRSSHPSFANQCARKQAEQDAAQFSADIQAVMNTPAGRRLFMRLLYEGGVYSRSTPTDDRAYVAGRRDAALEVMNAVNQHAVGQSLSALQEHNALVERRNAERLAAIARDCQEKKEITHE